MKFASNNSIDLDLKSKVYTVNLSNKGSKISIFAANQNLRIMQSNEDLERFYFPYLWVYHRKI